MEMWRGEGGLWERGSWGRWRRGGMWWFRRDWSNDGVVAERRGLMGG